VEEFHGRDGSNQADDEGAEDDVSHKRNFGHTPDGVLCCDVLVRHRVRRSVLAASVGAEEIRRDEWNPRPELGEIRIAVQEEGSQPLTPQAGCLKC
jgi:hypothetical protein